MRSLAKEYEEKVQLRSRNPAGFILSVVALVLFVIILVGGGIAGYYYGRQVFRTQFGIGLTDIISCYTDINGYDYDESDNVVYTEEDRNTLYNAINSALYFKDGVIDDAFIADFVGNVTESQPGNDDAGQDGVTTSAQSDAGSDSGNGIQSLFRKDNFDADKLGEYDWRTTSTGMVVSDRSLGAVLNEHYILSGSMDKMFALGDSFGDLKLSDLISLSRLTITRGSDMSEEDKQAYGMIDDGVYLMLSLSVNVKTVVRQAMSSRGASGLLTGIVVASIPEKVNVSASVNLKDINDGIRININDMAQKTCNMEYISEEMEAKYGSDGTISKFDRLCIVIETFSGIDLQDTVNKSAGLILKYICKGGEETGFCLADIIDLDSVTRNDDGSNSFAIDINGLMKYFAGEEMEISDLLVILQALICTDVNDALDMTERVDFYTNDMDKLKAAMQACGIESVEDIDSQAKINRLIAAGASVITADPGMDVPDNFVSIYSGLMENAVFDAFEIEGAEDYTMADIIAIMQNGQLTDEQKALLEQIKNKVEGGASGTAPVFRITDKMLGAAIRDMTDSLGVPSSYDISVHSLTISENGGRYYADITASVVLADSTQSDGDYTDLLSGRMAVGMRVEITPDAAVRDDVEWISFNGVGETGSVAPIEELTMERLRTAIDNTLNLDLSDMLGGVKDGVADVLDNLKENFGDIEFVASDAA